MEQLTFTLIWRLHHNAYQNGHCIGRISLALDTMSKILQDSLEITFSRKIIESGSKKNTKKCQSLILLSIDPII